jgi:hypothetical protein
VRRRDVGSPDDKRTGSVDLLFEPDRSGAAGAGSAGPSAGARGGFRLPVEEQAEGVTRAPTKQLAPGAHPALRNRAHAPSRVPCAPAAPLEQDPRLMSRVGPGDDRHRIPRGIGQPSIAFLERSSAKVRPSLDMIFGGFPASSLAFTLSRLRPASVRGGGPTPLPSPPVRPRTPRRRPRPSPPTKYTRG